MEESPLVSICSLCYNHSSYIESYMKGILAQTYPNLELILCDDASTDNSVEIIEKFLPLIKNKIKHVVFIKNSINQGIVKNCNTIIAHATGKYIRLISTDDILISTSIQELVEYIETHKDMAMCYSKIYSVENDYTYDYKEQPVNCYFETNRTFHYEGNIFLPLLYDNFIPVLSTLVKREIFEKYGSFDLEIGFEDYEYWLRISRKEKIGFLDTYTAYYRRGQNSMTNYKNKNGMKNYAFILRETKKILKKYLPFVSIENQIKIKEHFYQNALKLSIYYNFLPLTIKIYKVIRHDNKYLDLSLQEEYKKYLLNIGTWIRY